MTRKRFSPLALAAMLSAAALSGCAMGSGGDGQGVIPAAVWQSWTSQLRARSQRIQNLLAQCEGPGRAGADAAIRNIVLADARLDVSPTASDTDGYNAFGITSNQAEPTLNAFFATQDAALAAAKACGLVAPDVPPNQDWDATWFDISS